MFIPAHSDVKVTLQKLYMEGKTADNIKDLTHRALVKKSLSSLIFGLKQVRGNDNGVAAFSSPETKCVIFQPSIPLNLSIYRCDKTFYVEPLKRVIAIRFETFGLVLMTGKETKFYSVAISPASLLSVKPETAFISQTLLSTHHSFIRNKHGRGGFSANRFERLRENECDHYGQDVLKIAKNLFASMVAEFWLGSKDKLPSKKWVRAMDVSNKKTVAQQIVDFSMQHYKDIEEQVCNVFYSRVQQKQQDSEIVFGWKEVSRALEEKIVERVLMGSSFVAECERFVVQKTVCYGFSAISQRFIDEYGIIAHLFKCTTLYNSDF